VLNDEGDFIGFDVIIGNPPYGVKLDIKSKDLFKITFSDIHTRTPDTFNYFMSLSLSILKQKGFNSFIVPNNLLYQNENELSRELIVLKHNPILFLNLGDNIFEDANVPTCLFVIQKIKQPNSNNIIFHFYDARVEIDNLNYSIEKFIFEKYETSYFKNTPNKVFGISKKLSIIISKIENKSLLINDVADEVASGISTGADKVFRLHNDKIKSLNIETDLIRNVMVGSDFNRYMIKPNNHQLIYSIRKLEIDNYPNFIKYLSDYKDKLLKRSECKLGILPWYSLGRQRYQELFEGKKIIIRQTSNNIKATIDYNSNYVLNSIIIFRLKNESDYKYEFLLGILNSKLINKLYELYSQEKGRTFAEVKPNNIRKLPFPNINLIQQQPIIDLVEKILDAKKGNPEADTSHWESEIDTLVYKLYNLTEEEIQIIEEG